MSDGKVERISTAQLFGGRRVIVFALPGAFTPTCSTAHVPGYVAYMKEFREAGVDDIVCLSVNDPYVMDAWQQSEKADGIHFVADAFGEFTHAMGMRVENREAFLGTRSWRYSMLVEDGRIRKMFIEPDQPGESLARGAQHPLRSGAHRRRAHDAGGESCIRRGESAAGVRERQAHRRLGPIGGIPLFERQSYRCALST